MKLQSNPFFRSARFAAALSFILATIPAHATIYYWDNAAAVGFGTAGGTWGSDENWSEDATGAAAPGVTTTTAFDDLNFGSSTLGLTTGTITVDTVIARAMTFGAASGAITLSGGSITLSGNVTTSGTPTTTHTINSDIVLSGSRMFGTNGSLANEKFIFGGNISGTGASLLADTNNSTGIITLSGNNSFTGNITIGRGQLNVNTVADKLSNSSLGAGSKILMGLGGGQAPTVHYTGTAAGSTNRDIEFNSAGTNSFISQAAPLTLSGTIKNTAAGLSGSLTLTGDAGGGANLNEVSGMVQDNGTSKISIQLWVAAPVGGATENGFWKLSGDNNYSGTTAVSNGSVLVISHNNALGSTVGGTSVNQNASLLLMGNIAVGAEALTLASGGGGVWNSQSGAALRNYSGNNSFAGAITLSQATVIATNSGTTFTLAGGITGAQNLTFSSAGDTTVSTTGITTGTGTLTKIDSGTLTLSATNTYTGTTTVTNGALLVNGNQSAATGAVTVASPNGTLGGTGTIGGATTVNGKLAPGSNGVGKLTFVTGGLTLGSLAPSSMKFELGAPTTAGTTYDTVATNALDIGALDFSDFQFTDIGALAAGTYTLISSGATITGSISTASGTIGAFTGTLSIAGSNLVLNVSGGGSPYATWAAGFPGFTPTTSNLDFENDGIPNLLEFVLGGNPKSNDSPSIRPTVSASGSDLVVTFNRTDLSETQPVTIKVQTSPDLVNWTNFATIGAVNGSGYTVAENGAATDNIIVTIPKAAATKKFARVTAE